MPFAQAPLTVSKELGKDQAMHKPPSLPSPLHTSHSFVPEAPSASRSTQKCVFNRPSPPVPVLSRSHVSAVSLKAKALLRV